MNKDQVAGRAKEVVGKTKEVVGKVIDDKELQVKGVVEKTVGKVQANYGDAKAELKKDK